MQWLNLFRILMILTPVLSMTFAGCAGAPVNKTLSAEEALAAAGFQLKMADTPTKLDHIKRIPQKKVVRTKVEDREIYLWADAAGCQCYYSGTRQNYEQLLQNQHEKQAEQRANWYEAQHQDPLWFEPGWDD